jgi:hypothetical protein
MTAGVTAGSAGVRTAFDSTSPKPSSALTDRTSQIWGETGRTQTRWPRSVSVSACAADQGESSSSAATAAASIRMVRLYRIPHYK